MYINNKKILIVIGLIASIIYGYNYNLIISKINVNVHLSILYAVVFILFIYNKHLKHTVKCRDAEIHEHLNFIEFIRSEKKRIENKLEKIKKRT